MISDFVTPLRADLVTLSEDAPIKLEPLDIKSSVMRVAANIYGKLYSGHTVDDVIHVSSNGLQTTDGEPMTILEVWTRFRNDQGKWVFGTVIRLYCTKAPIDRRLKVPKSEYIVWDIAEDNCKLGKPA